MTTIMKSKSLSELPESIQKQDAEERAIMESGAPIENVHQILSIAQDKIQATANVWSDGWRVYQKLDSNGFGHQCVIVSKDNSTTSCGNAP